MTHEETPIRRRSGDNGTLICMGTLSRPHGIKGEIRVDWHADSPDLLRGVFYLQAGVEAPVRVTGAGVRLHQGRPVLRLPHVPDRSAAESLRGARLLVDRNDLPPPDADEAYLFDIIGFTVVDDATEQAVGVLERVDSSTAQDIWSIRAADGREVLFPAAAELIAAFDEAARAVRVVVPLGLLDIYAAPQATSSE